MWCLKDPVSNLTGTRHDATDLRTKISFFERSRSEQRWCSKIGETIPWTQGWPSDLIIKDSSRPTQRLGGDVVRVELKINVVPALQVDAIRD